MRIIVDIGHPSQVHFFKNFILDQQKKGNQVLVTVSDKDMAIALLKAFGIKYINLGTYGKSLLKKIINLPVMDLKMYKIARDFKPDILLGFGSVRASHVAWFIRKPSIIFDGDHFSFPYYKWFAKTICLFSGFEKTGRKIINIRGYKELAYLHPEWFRPNPAAATAQPITLLRFVSRAFHDIGKEVFDLEFKRKLVAELSKCSTVYISSEAPLPDDLERYRININPEDMHNFLSNINLLVTDSGTMTTEAAVLGVPVVRCSTFIGHSKLGIFKELEAKYGLVFNYRDPKQALQKAVVLAQNPDIRILWEQKRKDLLRDKIDVTSFMIWFVEHYPHSIEGANSYPASNIDL